MFWFSNKKEEKENKNFNVIITGYGGQGVLTITELISKIALSKNFDTRQAEIHGLAQRGGSLQAQVRFGSKIFSPKIKRADADLIISLDLVEASRACYWASPNKTIILSEKEIYWPIGEKLDPEKLIEETKKFAKVLDLQDAGKIATEISGNPKASNIYLLGYAIAKNYLSFEKEEAWNIIEKNLNPEFIESNKLVFEKAFEKE
jgi:indolepyruvate ferredoxin oxidoreductase beta subunit